MLAILNGFPAAGTGTRAETSENYWTQTESMRIINNWGLLVNGNIVPSTQIGKGEIAIQYTEWLLSQSSKAER